MKLYFAITFFLLLAVPAFAQQLNVDFVDYFKMNGQAVKIKDSADYVRAIQKPDSGEVNYKVFEFYADGTRKFRGQVSSINPVLVCVRGPAPSINAVLVYEGVALSFFKNGRRSELINYENGHRVGQASFYYPNGKLKKVVEYGKEGMEEEIGGKELKYKVLTFYDSSGVQTVINGSGHAKEFLNDDKTIEEGNYLNGVREGTWRGSDIARSSSYEETYKNGVFVSGIRTLSDGRIIIYKQLMEQAQPKDGFEKFYEYISKNLRSPNEARENGIQGKVIVQFVIDDEGTLKKLSVLRSLHPKLDKEVLRVVQNLPPWQPGRLRGFPVESSFILPVDFNFQY